MPQIRTVLGWLFEGKIDTINTSNREEANRNE